MFREEKDEAVRQALLLRSGYVTLKFSLQAALLLVGLGGVVFFTPWLLEWDQSQQVIYLLASTAVAGGWWILRHFCADRFGYFAFRKSANSNSYGALDRGLHWLALGPEVVRRLTFALECRYALSQSDTAYVQTLHGTVGPADGAVYVCGLARSGTTMLLRTLNEIDVFRSMTYRDMPFVLAPNLWSHISRYAQHPAVSVERAHADGIRVDFDSPEGFEEVFWRTFGSRSADLSCLGFNQPSAVELATFAGYRALVANPKIRGKDGDVLRRYLSKNNNNLLRLSSLGADPTAVVLLVYRNPVATARSLYRQHQRFCEEQQEDKFIKVYMDWLLHHEFGLGHLPFSFAVPRMNTSLKPGDLDYWLDYWDAVYRYVLEQVDARFYLVNHDELRAEPVETLKSILAVINVETEVSMLARQILPLSLDGEDVTGFSADLLRRVDETHQALLNSHRNVSRVNIETNSRCKKIQH